MVSLEPPGGSFPSPPSCRFNAVDKVPAILQMIAANFGEDRHAVQSP
jgi:hypothetical protein